MHSTWPEPLTRLYDECAYIEIDPLIQDVPVLDEVGKLNVARNLGDVLMFQRYAATR